MKKLKLNLQQLGNAEVLTRAQLKTILGGEEGSGGTECAANCNPGFVSFDNCSGTCTATDDEGVKCGTEKKCCPGFAC
jgi:hypothetical protein